MHHREASRLSPFVRLVNGFEMHFVNEGKGGSVGPVQSVVTSLKALRRLKGSGALRLLPKRSQEAYSARRPL